MAFDFSKLNFFSRLDARARVLVLFAGLVGFGLLIYLLTTFLSSESTTIGPSSAARAPSGLTTIPGAEVDPEFASAIQQANEENAKNAKMSSGTSMPTIINTGSRISSDAGCTILCGDESIDVKNDLDAWVRAGKLNAVVSSDLQKLANQDVSVAEYSAELDRLVKEGKLTPEQARTLLDQYTKQHVNKQVSDSAKSLDSLIKSGDLPLDAANALLAAQKKNVSPADYAAMLQEMVRQGKIDSNTAARLLKDYMEQRAKEIVMRSITSLRKMQAAGQLTPDVLAVLEDLERRMVPVDEYAGKLKEFVDAGKLTPVVSTAILSEFKQQKSDIGNISSIGALTKGAEDEAFQELRELVRDKLITPETAARIGGMINDDVTFAAFQQEIIKMVTAGDLTQEISLLKLADYKKVKDLRDLAAMLQALRDRGAPCSEHEEVLRDAAARGVVDATQAAQLLKECHTAQLKLPTGVPTSGSKTDFQKLTDRMKNAEPIAGGGGGFAAGPETFEQAQSQSQQELYAARQARIEAMAAAMQGQAGQLLAAWQPPVMLHREGVPPEDKTKTKGGAAGADGEATADATGADSTTPPVIKAGTVLFAVLDTAVNSDYPDSPVMATIVSGKYKGGKLLGKLVTTKGVTGQLDRVTLNFTLMNMDDWIKSKPMTAFAIDPDTARSALASNVNNRYLSKNAALIATAFLEGFGEATASSGGSTTQSAFGTSTTSPVLGTAAKIAVGIGQVAQSYGEVTKKYAERPATVTVDSGVGLGILFMTDVT